MNGFGAFLFAMGALIFPFIAMFLLWRRMKRVRDKVYRARKPDRRETSWEEDLTTDGNVSLTRVDNPNYDLVDLGSRATRIRWPIDAE